MKTPTYDRLTVEGRLLYVHETTDDAADYAYLMQQRLTEAGADTYRYVGNRTIHLLLMSGVTDRATTTAQLSDELFYLNHPELPDQEPFDFDAIPTDPALDTECEGCS